MPIKTRNMAGLQKWEETDDYIIYVDKDAVMTTVQNYVTGTYDLFLERKNQIDGAMELLKDNGIEWTAEDDSKLLQDINLVQLERTANTPTTMDEPTEIQTFEVRTVPTTYECCFRTDKKTGEIYIGEGYENLSTNFYKIKKNDIHNGRMTYTETTVGDNSFSKYKIGGYVEKENYHFDIIAGLRLPVGNVDDEYFLYYKQKTLFNGDFKNHVLRYSKFCTMPELVEENAYLLKKSITYTYEDDINALVQIQGVETGITIDDDSWIEISNQQITKTSTPKPFVKSVMPSGKLSFVTNATSETHSFVTKDSKIEASSNAYGVFRLYNCGNFDTENIRHSESSMDFRGGDWLISKNYKKITPDSDVAIFEKGKTSGVFKFGGWNKGELTSLKQLLIYKGNLTEVELKAENEKVIKLK